MEFKDMGIMIVGDLPSGIPLPVVPHIFGSSSVIIQGFIVAVVAYVGSLGLAKSLARDSPFPYEINANSELVAYGMASVIGSFFSGFPPAASFSRSALAFEMQARTPLHGIFTASLMCIALYLTVAFKFLPKCVLAVVIVMSVRRLFLNGFKELHYLIRVRSRDFFECVICLVGVCVLGITDGIVIGFIMSFVNYIYGNSFAAVTTKNPTDILPDRTRLSTEGKEGDRIRQSSEGQMTKATTKPSPAGGPDGGPTGAPRENRIASFSISMPKQQAVVIQPGAGVFYANVAKVTDTIKDAVRNIGDTLVLDLRYSPCLDSTAARGILDSLKDAAEVVNNIVVSNCCDTVKTDLQRYARRSDAHVEMLKHNIKIIGKSY
jgi:MFS superfamily sulfate permease-like transporter